jgi:PQQ-dependent catabolism-associated CXXCW motif protein
MSDAMDALGEPYPGLRSFRRDETHIFFGREGTISDMVTRLAAHRFLAVTGHSGSGKSSLVRTGLIDALDRGLLVEAGSDWSVADFSPGGQPYSRLTAALVKAIGGTRSDQELGLIEAKLARGPLGLVDWLDEIDFNPQANVLLLVDQFEEIFRYRQGQTGDDIDAFVALLLATAKQRKRRVYVAMTMRSDFLGDCARFTGLAETINDGQFLTPRLTRDQCRAAIEGPAAVYGGRIEPVLVTRMLNDMGGNPDQLPLMQHVLMLLWQEARARAGDQPPELTLEHYRRLGGIGVADAESDIQGSAKPRKPSLLRRMFGWFRRKGAGEAGDAAAPKNRNVNGAVSDHADLVLSELTVEQQRLASSLFRALTESVGTGGRDVRRPVKLAQAAAITEAPVSALIAVVEAFRAPGRNFLTPLAPTPLTPETIIDISHESLIRQWVKLRQWVREEFQSAETYRYIERHAKQWKNGLGNLLAKLDLAVARNWRRTERPNRAWAERYGDAFDLAMMFLLKSERHRRWRRATIAVTASGVLLVVLSTTFVAVALMALMTSGLSYVNPADEWSNFSVDPQSELKKDVGTNTPLTIPGGRVIGTAELESALNRGTLENVPFLAIDAWRRSNTQIYVPKSIYIDYAGDSGTFDDDVQNKLAAELAKLTDNNINMPLVFFCVGAKCWESYNAALRAIKLGYTKVHWYRGGITSWQAAHQPYPIDFSRIPIEAIGAGLSTIWSAVRDKVWPDPAYYLARGMDYAEKKQYDNAVDDFTKAISLDPGNADAYVRRALAYASKDAYDAAMTDFDKAYALKKSPEVEAMRRDPKFAAGYIARGKALHDEKKYAPAIEEYEKAIQLAPDNFDAYYNRAVTYYTTKNYVRAIEDYDRAIALNPKSILAHNGRGNAYYSKGDYDHAISSYGQAIALNPKEKILHSNRAGAYVKKGDFDRAILDYNSAIAIDPKYADAYQGRGNCYAEKEDYEKAISDLTLAVVLDPSDISMVIDRSKVYLSKRDYTHAIQDATDVINRQPANADAYWRRARARLYSDAADQAADDLLAAVKLRPKNQYLVTWLHLARMRSGHDGTDELTANAKELDQTQWPSPVINLFLGSAIPEQVISSAHSADPNIQNDQLCQAAFYVGIYQGAKGLRDAARQSFQNAINSCPKSFVEFHAAKEELARLQ